MFLDTNGDSASTFADSLTYPGDNEVRIWLVTDRNRDGSPASCPGGGDLTLNSYEVVLRASGSGIVWQEYTNLQMAMTIPVGNATGGTDTHLGFAGTQTLPPGKYCLGIQTVSVASPDVAIHIVPDTPLNGGYATSFGSACQGHDTDNTLKLGVDWLDVDGVGTTAALDSQGYTGVVATTAEGTVYLGGNRIAAPYEFSYVDGQLAVNGLAMPPPAQPARVEANYTDTQLSQMALFQHMADVADSLQESGVGTDDVGRTLLGICQSSSLIDSVAYQSGSLTWRYIDGTRAGITLRSGTPSPPTITRASVEKRELEHLQNLIDAGSTLFIIGGGRQLIVPRGRSSNVDVIVKRLLRGEALTAADAVRIPQQLQEQLRNPALLVRVK